MTSGCSTVSVSRLALADFRNIRAAAAPLSAQSVVITGANGAGKTNCLEAVSVLAPGKGLRGANAADLTRHGAAAWAVSARLRARGEEVAVGTGLAPDDGRRPSRIVKINGEEHGTSNALDAVAAVIWLTPAMDGLFTGPAAERRRFLDRLTGICAPGHRTQLARFELAMRQRKRLLDQAPHNSRLLDAYEQQMAEHAVAIAAARLDALDALRAVIENRRLREDSVFPWAEAAIDGALEASVAEAPAVEVEDQYMRQLRESRERDRAARRTLTGPHASDFAVIFGPKDSPARICSTGEQKALLIGLILAQAEMIKSARGGEAPIILLDEIIAHLDERRREALFSEIFRLDSQAWMTGTEPEPFAALAGKAQFLHVADGAVTQSKAAAPASAAIKRRMRAT